MALESRGRNGPRIVHDRESRPLKTGEVLEDRLSGLQRAVRNERRKDIAKIIEDRLSHDERQRRFVPRGKSSRSLFVERDDAADDARPLAIIVDDDCANVRRQGTSLERTIRSNDIDLVAV